MGIRIEVLKNAGYDIWGDQDGKRGESECETCDGNMGAGVRRDL